MGISLKGFGGGDSAGSGNGASIQGMSALPPEAANVRLPESAPVGPSDPYYNDVVLHLPLQSDTVDTKGGTVNLTGAPSIVSSTSPYASGGSLQFNGSNYLEVADNASYELASGDFTIDCWARFTTSGGYRSFLTKSADANGASPYLMQITPTDGIQFIHDEDGAGPMALSYVGAAQIINTWNHYATVRSGNNIYLFINGNLATTISYTSGLVDNSAPLALGALFLAGTGYLNYFTGEVADLRVTKGVARYTTNFSVPTEAYPTS